MAPEPIVRALEAADMARLDAHFVRHRAESGRDEPHFMPFAPSDPEGPRGADLEACGWPTTEPGWQRWLVASAGAEIVGHVNLRAGKLRAALHRCDLGIGIERAYRGRGLGRRLMAAAIELARSEAAVEWIDLRVFAHNAAARALYRSAGFVEIATVQDCLRIDGGRIDDVIMTLRLHGASPADRSETAGR